jgi:hypothetical protein
MQSDLDSRSEAATALAYVKRNLDRRLRVVQLAEAFGQPSQVIRRDAGTEAMA